MANSTSEAVGDAAVAAVTALGILKPGVTPTAAVPIARRKNPTVPEGDSLGLPQFVVTVGEEGPVENITAKWKRKRYPVAVTIVTATGLQAADDVTVRKWRQQIEEKLAARATWAGVTGFNETNLTNRIPFDPTALPKDFNFATVVAEVVTVEART